MTIAMITMGVKDLAVMGFQKAQSLYQGYKGVRLGLCGDSVVNTSARFSSRLSYAKGEASSITAEATNHRVIIVIIGSGLGWHR
ncbi:MAG: hypothetical protein HN980_04810 [Waddliaceae bacterium]|jgi:hypothetical protein|nr:hypothetical protein [Candidatus Jacksonbacteria bacterium]MBT6928797.1 hypothetical protein [Waddliaceae bacterium]